MESIVVAAEGSGVARKGIGYIAKWHPEDIQYTITLFSKIRTSANERNGDLNRRLIDYLYSSLDRVWNDHKIQDFEPTQVVKSHNRIVNDGMVRIAELVTGTVGINTTTGFGSGLWTHLAVGVGGNAVSASDNRLFNELARVGLGSDGFQSAAGSVMRFGGFFAPTLPSATILEAGVFDDPAAGLMLFRTVYPIGLVHVINNDFMTVAHSIYQVSV